MDESDNKGDPALRGKLFELQLYLLFLHRGSSKDYSFQLYREKNEEAGKLDDIVFKFEESGRCTYRLLQAKHTTIVKNKIKQQQLLKGKNYSLIKYFYSYRDKKEQFLQNGDAIKDLVICTNITFDFEDLALDGIELLGLRDVDTILDVISDNRHSRRYQINPTDGIVEKIKKKLAKDVAKVVTDEQIKAYLKLLTFAVDMPMEHKLGDILRKEIGEGFDDITSQDIYNRLFKRMLDWTRNEDSRKFWSSEDAKSLLLEVKKGIPILFNIPSPIELFIPRERKLDEIHELFKKKNVICVSGLGGVGKTELVKKYADEYGQHYDNKLVWINAESYEALERSFQRLASYPKLGIRTKYESDEERPTGDIVQDVYQSFYKSKSLFIFDNAEKYQYRNKSDSGTINFWPSLPKNLQIPKIIITSRNNEWPEKVEMIHLDVFKPCEAANFISKSLEEILKYDKQDESVRELAETLQFLPLALQQAVSYILVQYKKLQNIGEIYWISEYIKGFSEERKKYLDYKFPDHCDSTYAETVWTTWDVTLKAIREESTSNDSLNVLHIMSFLLPDNIHAEMLMSVFNVEKRKLVDAIELLKKYSLVNVRNAVYSLHRLVQLVAREKLEGDEQRQVLEKMLKDGKIEDNVFYPHYYVDHFVFLWKHFTENCRELVKEYYYIPATLAVILSNSGRLEKAHSLGLETLELMENFSFSKPNEQRWVRKMSPIIVKFLHGSGQYKETVDKTEQILKVFNDMQCSNHDKVDEFWLIVEVKLMALMKTKSYSTIHSWLGTEMSVDRLKGEHNRYGLKILFLNLSIKLKQCDRFVSFYISKYRDDDIDSQINNPDDVRLCRKIAELFSELCLFEKATGFIINRPKFPIQVSNILEEASREQDLPNNHIDKLEMQESLANTFIVRGNYKDALKIIDEIISFELDRNNYKLRTKKGLILALLKENDNVLKILEDLGKDISEAESEKNHPGAVDCLMGIALIKSLVGNVDDALSTLEQVLDLFRRSNDYNEIEDENIFKVIGFNYLKQEKMDEALNALGTIWKYRTNITPDYSILLKIYDLYNEKDRIDGALLYGGVICEFYELTYIEKDGEIFAEPCLSKENYLKIKTQVDELLKSQRMTKTNNPNMDLITAIEEDRLENLKLLLKHKAAVRNFFEFQTSTGDTVLHIASSKGRLDIMNLLLRRGAAYDKKNKEGKSALQMTKDITIRAMLKDVEMYFGYFPLLNNDDYKKAFEKLENYHVLRSIAIINARNDADGYNLLQLAVKNNRKQLVELFLNISSEWDLTRESGIVEIPESKNNIFSLEKDASSILQINEYSNNYSSLITDLVKKFREDEFTWSSSILAIEDMLQLLDTEEGKDCFELSKLVIEKHISLFLKKLHTRQLLTTAQLNNLKAFEQLLEKGASVNEYDRQMMTALHHAAKNGNKKMVELLLSHPNIEIQKNAIDETPMHIAFQSGNIEIVKLLLFYDIRKDFRKQFDLGVYEAINQFFDKLYTGQTDYTTVEAPIEFIKMLDAIEPSNIPNGLFKNIRKMKTRKHKTRKKRTPGLSGQTDRMVESFRNMMLREGPTMSELTRKLLKIILCSSNKIERAIK